MRFVVNDVAAVPNGGGVYSILEDFYNQVLKEDHENEWFFILAGKYFKESQNVKIIVRDDLKKSKVKKFLFETLIGGKYINSFNPDVYISLQNIATLNVRATQKIVYLHQPIPFVKEKTFKFLKKDERKLAFYQRAVGKIIKMTLKKVQPTVIVQTEWMRRRVMEQAAVTKISVVHPKVGIATEGKKYSGNGKSFFYPASNFVYKNHEVIYKAILELQNRGIDDFKVVFTLSQNQLPYKNRHIQYLGHISRKKVMNMYTNNILLFPSYIESFGLPLIEAAMHADIVLAANTEFARELLGNYNNVYFYSSTDFCKLASLMEKTIKREIISNGTELSVKNTGENLLDTIKECIK